MIDGNVLTIPPVIGQYSESRSFSTEIRVSINGTEYRETRFNEGVPVRSVSGVWRPVSQEELTYLEHMVALSLTETIRVPLWLSLARLTADADGSDVISIDTTTGEFATCDSILLMSSDYGSAASYGVEAVTGTTATLDANVSGFLTGAIVVPCIDAIGHNGNAVELRNLRNGAANLRFAEIR